MPQATSTFSMARTISALASSKVLPHSLVMSARNFIAIGFEQIAQFEQILHTVLDGSSPPGRERLAGSLRRRVHIRLAATAVSLQSPRPWQG